MVNKCEFQHSASLMTESGIWSQLELLIETLAQMKEPEKVLSIIEHDKKFSLWASSTLELWLWQILIGNKLIVSCSCKYFHFTFYFVYNLDCRDYRHVPLHITNIFLCINPFVIYSKFLICRYSVIFHISLNLLKFAWLYLLILYMGGQKRVFDTLGLEF